MNVGDVVSVVFGFPPETWRGVVLSGADSRGRVLLRPINADPGASLFVPLHMIDVGSVTVATAHGHRHRATDPDTARAAADAAGERLTENQWLVLTALATAGPAGLIDHEHEPRNGLRQDTAGKRRLELQRLGLVEPTDRRKLTERGVYARVHRITARGLTVYQHHQRSNVA